MEQRRGEASVEPGDPLSSPSPRSARSSTQSWSPFRRTAADRSYLVSARHIDWRLQESGLAPESIALLKRLLYAQGENLLLFADFEPALRSLPSDAERRRFMKAISRKRAVLARLRLDPDADVEKISQYWGVGGRRKDVFPFLNAPYIASKRVARSI